MKLFKGMRVTCKIHDKEVKDTMIQEENGRFYICQNVKDGSNCTDKLGYQYSWDVSSGSEEDLRMNSVTKLHMVNPLMEYVQEGDVLIDGTGRLRKVLGRCGEAVFISLDDNYDFASRSVYSVTELRRTGYSIAPVIEEEIKEITMKDIAESFNIDIKNIRIKDYEK